MDDYKLTLRKLALRDDRFIDSLLSQDRASASVSGIDPLSHALLRIAALIAIDAAPPSYMSAVEAGLDAGASYDEIVGHSSPVGRRTVAPPRRAPLAARVSADPCRRSDARS